MQSHQTCTYDKPSDNQRLKKDEGFTLIEVLLAVSIFAIGLLGVAAMQISAIRTNSVANYMTLRATWAQDKLEQLRALPFTAPVLVDTDATVGAGTSYTEPSPPAGYVITWDVDDDTLAPNTKTITLTVTKGGKTNTFVTIKSLE